LVKQQAERQQRREAHRAEDGEDRRGFALVYLPIVKNETQRETDCYDVTQHRKRAEKDQEHGWTIRRREMPDEQLTDRRSKHARRKDVSTPRRDHASGKVNQAKKDRGRDQLASNYQCA